MLRYLILSCIVITASLCNAQQTSGRAVYEKSTAIKVNLGNSDPAMQRMLVDLPKSFDKRAELLFSAAECLYQDIVAEPVDKPEGPPSSTRTISFVSGAPERYHFDHETRRVQQVRSVLDRQFTVEDEAIFFDWQETGHTSFDAITGLPTREATAVHSDGDTIVVQYTPSIALPYGPEEYQGLPGLIVQLQKGKVSFQLQELTLLDEAPAMPLPKAEGKTLTREKLDALRERKEQALIDGMKSKGTVIQQN
ncbi:MAG: GLPGLI family protein [Saprospiraceae bacterium]